MSSSQPGNENFFSPLHCACARGHVEVVRLLLAAGADANKVVAHSPFLRYAFSERDERIFGVPYLQAVQQGLQISGAPLHAACRKGSLEIVSSLMEAGADVNALTAGSETPLFIAAMHGYHTIVSELLRGGADPLLVNYRNMSPFSIACYGRHYECARLLLSAGSNVNQVDNFGCTPLIEAVVFGHKDIIRLLLGAGAAKNIASDTVQIALLIARENNDEELVCLLSDT